MKKILIATSNPGKLRDFAGAAAAHDIEITAIPNLAALPVVLEDGLTFEENARKKAEQYSLAVPGEIVLASATTVPVLPPLPRAWNSPSRCRVRQHVRARFAPGLRHSPKRHRR